MIDRRGSSSKIAPDARSQLRRTPRYSARRVRARRSQDVAGRGRWTITLAPSARAKRPVSRPMPAPPTNKTTVCPNSAGSSEIGEADVAVLINSSYRCSDHIDCQQHRVFTSTFTGRRRNRLRKLEPRRASPAGDASVASHVGNSVPACSATMYVGVPVGPVSGLPARCASHARRERPLHAAARSPVSVVDAKGGGRRVDATSQARGDS